MDKSDPGLFEGGVATLNTLGTPRNTSGTVVGTTVSYRLGFLPTTSTAYYWCLISTVDKIRHVSYKRTS